MPYKYNEIDLAGLTNRSVLVVDDTHSIHRDYKAVLCPDQRDESERQLEALEELLLGDPDSPTPDTHSRVRNFELQPAYQGEEAYHLVKKHRSKGIRYPLALVDMRMPPGWDGLETIERLREIDSDMTFAIVTAYSDHTNEEIEARLGNGIPAEIVYKPFDPEALYELCYRVVAAWNARHAT